MVAGLVVREFLRVSHRLREAALTYIRLTKQAHRRSLRRVLQDLKGPPVYVFLDFEHEDGGYVHHSIDVRFYRHGENLVMALYSFCHGHMWENGSHLAAPGRDGWGCLCRRMFTGPTEEETKKAERVSKEIYDHVRLGHATESISTSTSTSTSTENDARWLADHALSFSGLEYLSLIDTVCGCYRPPEQRGAP